jgi:hypothetical protein
VNLYFTSPAVKGEDLASLFPIGKERVKKDGMSRQICMVVATALLAAVAEVPLDIAGKFPFQFRVFLLNLLN